MNWLSPFLGETASFIPEMQRPARGALLKCLSCGFFVYYKLKLFIHIIFISALISTPLSFPYNQL
jgi:hypothetical protein